MQRAWLIAAVLLLPLTTGCLGSVEPATVPQETLRQEGWESSRPQSESLAAGLAEKVTIEYRPSSDSTGATGVIVVTANDVPILDESQFIPQAIEQVEEQRNIDLRRTGTTPLNLVNLDSQVEADVYEFSKSGAQGRALLFTPSCGPFVVVAAYGLTEPIGISGNPTFQSAKDVASAVTC